MKTFLTPGVLFFLIISCFAKGWVQHPTTCSKEASDSTLWASLVNIGKGARKCMPLHPLEALVWYLQYISAVLVQWFLASWGYCLCSPWNAVWSFLGEEIPFLHLALLCIILCLDSSLSWITVDTVGSQFPLPASDFSSICIRGLPEKNILFE